MAQPSERTNKARRLADELEGIEWDEPTQPNIHVHLGNAGGFKAADLPTVPDNEKPESDPPPKAAKWALALIRAVDNWPRALVAVAILVLAGFAIWKGVTGLPVANP